MGETHQGDESRTLAMLKTAASFAPMGAVAGSYIANELFPPTVEITPELSVEASMATGDGALIPLGPAAELNFPAMVPDIPGPWNAIKLDASNIHNVHIPKDIETWVDRYAVGLFTQADSSIVEPIRHALIERLLLGAGIGAVVTGALGAIAFDYARIHRKDKKVQEAAEQIVPEYTDLTVPPYIERPPAKRWRNVLKPLTALAVASAFVGGLVQSAQTPTSDHKAIPLPGELTSLNKALKGATIKGPLEKLPSTLVDGFVEVKKEADRSFATSAEHFTEAYTTFAQNNERYRELRSNPNIRSLLHGSDIHCNFAYAENAFGEIINIIQPDIFMNTGDTQTYSGSIPLENGCFPALLNKLGDIPMVNVNGNHDEKTSVEDTITLNKDNDYRAEVKGIEFVGDDDPENTSWNATKESDQDDLDKESIKRGNHIADAACEIAEETGIKPIALAHRWQMLAESIMRGCITIGNSGHFHEEWGVQGYVAEDGITPVLQHTAGSATGTGTSVSFFYNKPATIGYLMEQLYNQATNTFYGFVTYTFNTDGTIAISFARPPQPATNIFPAKMSGYLTRQGVQHQESANARPIP